jgi:esterase/lipase superfamily enzyme
MGQILSGPKVITVGMKNGVLTVQAIVVAIACGSCSSRPVQGVLVPVAEIAGGTSRVPIFVATTRQRSTADPGEMFNGERAADVNYGFYSAGRFPEGR